MKVKLDIRLPRPHCWETKALLHGRAAGDLFIYAACGYLF